MPSLNVYPATYDLARIAGGQDIVLVLLTGARKRYRRYGTNETYVGSGQVCAIGAIAREAGLKPAQCAKIEEELGRDLGDDFMGTLDLAKIEEDVVSGAQEAIRLLDESAVRLYDAPVDGGRGWSGWSGPLEWLNQTSTRPWAQSKRAVLACYDDAIARRQAGVDDAV